MSNLQSRSATQASANSVPMATLEPANFLLITALSTGVGVGSAPVPQVTLVEDGHPETLYLVQPGLKIIRRKPWKQAILGGPANTTVSFIYGEEEHREDSTEFNSLTTQIQPSQTVLVNSSNGTTSNYVAGGIVVANGGNSITYTQNTGRRRITICALPTNTGFLFVVPGNVNTANLGLPIAPGAYVEFDTQAQLSVVNNSGANQAFSTIEEF